MNAPATDDALVARLRAIGDTRYHDKHPGFHARMHAGSPPRRAIQRWVENRFYYQTRIPIKDALVLSKSDDPAFRRAWIHRIVDHDGASEGDGGLALWLRLADGVGLDRARVARCEDVLPAVRFACDAYVTFVRERSLLEAVASSLTEFFAPDLMSTRIAAWEQHYPWVEAETLAYFREPRAARAARLGRGARLRARARKDRRRARALRRGPRGEVRDPSAMLDAIEAQGRDRRSRRLT